MNESSILFSSFALRSLTLRNRIVVAPMCQYSANEGAATDWHVMHLGNLGMSGASLLCIEATAVEPAGRITPGCLGLWDGHTEAALERVVKSVIAQTGVPVAIQLAHAGRKASTSVPWQGNGRALSVAEGGWQTYAPSDVPFRETDPTPLALDEAGLIRVRDAFVATARRAVRIGITAFELHAAHGYLMHQFLSPLSNQRTDAYGGSLENRMRFPLEIFDAVRAAVPDNLPVGVRVSASDWVDGGWDLQQTIAFAAALKQRGCDWIDASSGGTSESQKIPLAPGYQVPFAEAIKRETSINTIAVGLITDPRHAEQIVASGQADLVALARGLLYDPRWPWHAAAELGATIEAPPQYWRAPPSTARHLFDVASRS
ncbi:MAG: NADH:flavin oxidoreductase/NADH oxidase [Janthinobacterium lividum]